MGSRRKSNKIKSKGRNGKWRRDKYVKEELNKVKGDWKRLTR